MSARYALKLSYVQVDEAGKSTGLELAPYIAHVATTEQTQMKAERDYLVEVVTDMMQALIDHYDEEGLCSYLTPEHEKWYSKYVPQQEEPPNL